MSGKHVSESPCQRVHRAFRCLQTLPTGTQSQIDLRRQELYACFALMRGELHAMTQQMTIKLGTMMVVMARRILTLRKLT